MPEKTVHVPGIHCQGCARTIKNELLELEGIEEVEVDVESRRVKVQWADPLTWAEIDEALVELDYPPEAQE